MKKTILSGVLAALCLFSRVIAQDHPALKPLKPGDPVPDITLTGLQNYAAPTLKLHDLQDRLVILDFWAMWCASCIKMFPAIDKLQEQYQGKVLFLGVNATGEKRTQIAAFFKKHAGEFSFPNVPEDTVLKKLFPHHSIPHYVWLYQGKVAAITDAFAIHADTIARVLAGSRGPLYTKVDQTHRMDKPIFLDGNGGVPASYQYRSILTPYAPGHPSSIYMQTNGKDSVSRIQLVNATLTQMVFTAWPEVGAAPANRIRLNVKDTVAYRTTGESFVWQRQYRFTYESSFPQRPKREALQIFRDDLHRYFGLRVDSAMENKTCLVIQRRDTQPATSTGGPGTNWFNEEKGAAWFKNYPVDEVTAALNERSPLPILNESGGNALLSLELPSFTIDEGSLRAALIKHGYTLNRMERPVLVYTITDQNPHP
ncbi:TlpA family protein disulfide reductase [Mucilaginibacter terrae]|uniref:Thiol-disulfide isomerase/thioredoxin n=1 Tax=Mucilaginibacter terrae TaxID=1955052 RepID=A0ABU3GRA0_9SPHI|nr:TlpA disulfide reductase family protein [Mucilaginibacter terrae]MDT3402297.1 thiol-disulfide isomerase/thioredoxin [Mucilaginibacter terrae]